jgi:hypothetical protein
MGINISKVVERLVKKEFPNHREENYKTVAFSRVLEENYQKEYINNTLARLGRKDLPAVVLDGPGLKTSKALLLQHWKPRYIFIPNNSKDFKTISENDLKVITLNQSLNEFLENRRLQEQTIGLIYMDYMCSWAGNKVTKPISDLELLFNNRLLADGAVLGMTITTRTKNKGIFVNQSGIELISTILKLSINNGYYPELVSGGIYKNGGPMFSVIFTINRVPK